MLLGLGMIQEAARFANDFQFDDDEFTSELQKERQNYRFSYLSILHLFCSATFSSIFKTSRWKFFFTHYVKLDVWITQVISVESRFSKQAVKIPA